MNYSLAYIDPQIREIMFCQIGDCISLFTDFAFGISFFRDIYGFLARPFNQYCSLVKSFGQPNSECLQLIKSVRFVICPIWVYDECRFVPFFVILCETTEYGHVSKLVLFAGCHYLRNPFHVEIGQCKFCVFATRFNARLLISTAWAYNDISIL